MKEGHFKQVISSTLSAISERNIEVQFPIISLGGLSGSYHSDNKAYIPLPKNLSKKQVSWARGEADAIALFIKYHDEILHIKNRRDGEAGKLLDSMEEMRTYAIGALRMKGVAANLTVRYKNHNYDDNLQSQIALSAYYILSENYKNKQKNQYHDFLQKFIPALKHALNNQEEYAEIVNKMADILYSPLKNDVQQQGDIAQSESNPAQENDSEFSDKNDISRKDKKLKSTDENRIYGHSMASHLVEGNYHDYVDFKTSDNSQYKVYTKQFDEVISADKLAPPAQLKEYRKQIDKQLELLPSLVNKMTAKLQRKLMTQQLIAWDYNMESGVLDSTKFTSIITNPLYRAPYKQQRESQIKDTIISILIDNSGSMRGKSIEIAAACADILVRVFERCNVKIEILGFTTKEWKGGKSRKLWLEGRSPDSTSNSVSSNFPDNPLDNPGRLNDLLHIIYKNADDSWRKSKNNLGLMIKEGLLKENIDGEALLWANSRLLNRPEKRKILMVISDGAPVDDSTMSHNDNKILDRHLHEVTALIQKKSPVELMAIGIGHNVMKYYDNSVMIKTVDQLAITMLNQFTELFDR